MDRVECPPQDADTHKSPNKNACTTKTILTGIYRMNRIKGF
jgi:hypothetical protein